MQKVRGSNIESQGVIDSSFQTDQRDLFTSGVVAEIGVNAYAVWCAIKYHADFNTGQCWPGMRKLGELVGLSKSSIDRAVDVLQAAHMLRVIRPGTKRRGQTYIARERMSVRLGSRVICVIVLDYIPNQLRGRIEEVKSALMNPEASQDIFADIEIIPGDGFEWDNESHLLRGRIHASDLPHPGTDTTNKVIQEAVLKRIAPPKK